MMEFRFADPWLLLALLIPLVVVWLRDRRGGAVFSGFLLASSALRPSRGPLVFRVLMAAGLAALIIAAARPQFGTTITERTQNGRDLMLVIDLSGSMQVDDIAAPNGDRKDRLSAVFNAAATFIDKRPNDRLGLVFFSTSALTSCPLTYDHQTLLQFLDRTEKQQRSLWNNGHEGLLGNETNIGLGLGIALKRLKDTNSKGRAMVLITDGADSRELPNWIDPLEVARRAVGEQVKVYGIGVGNPDGDRVIHDAFGRTIRRPLSMDPGLLPDMPRLETIAKSGAGVAFAANDQAGLTLVFERIDALEPTPRTVTTHDDFSDRFLLPLAIGLALIALALGLEPRLRGVA